MPSPELAADILYTQVKRNPTAKIRVGSDTHEEDEPTVKELFVLRRKVGRKYVYVESKFAANVGLTAETFEVGENHLFVPGDILRSGTEYMKVKKVSGERLTVARGVFGEKCAHFAGRDVYAITDLIRDNLLTPDDVTPTHDSAHNFIKQVREALEAALAPQMPPIIPLPVLFIRAKGSSKIVDAWEAYTSNVVNCLVTQWRKAAIIMPDTHGPNVGGTNEFHKVINSKLRAAGVTAPVYVDAWYHHMAGGEVHCGSNALRAPLLRDWWEAWK